MKRPFKALTAPALLATTLTILGAATSAAPAAAAAPPVAAQAQANMTTVASVQPDAWSSEGLAPGRLSVIVHMQGDPVWRLDVAAQKATGHALGRDRLRAARRDIARRQAPAVRAVEAIGGQVVGQFQSTMNALQVHCTPEQLARIAKLPGVAAIAKAPIHTVDNKDVGPWTGATKVASLLGWDGKDSTIAIIDTGIDYTHKDFGGSGDPAEFAANDPNIVEEGTFPTAKVIGGYDLAGQYYSP
ncbi:MAG: hypothetical protein ABI780_10490, partial [Ardenticatenales bacterium]